MILYRCVLSLGDRQRTFTRADGRGLKYGLGTTSGLMAIRSFGLGCGSLSKMGLSSSRDESLYRAHEFSIAWW